MPVAIFSTPDIACAAVGMSGPETNIDPVAVFFVTIGNTTDKNNLLFSIIYVPVVDVGFVGEPPPDVTVPAHESERVLNVG